MWIPWLPFVMSSGRAVRKLVERSLFLPLSVAALFLGGCESGVDRTVETVVEQTYPVDPSAGISIKNTDGSIRIYGGSTHEIKLQAIKKAYSRERLDKISVAVSVQPTAVSIETIYPPQPKWGLFDRSGTVDYNLVVPSSCSISRVELVNGELLVEGMRGGHVQASLVNGRMLDHNCFADCHFLVENGGLDVAYDWWEHRKFLVDARVINGNARAFIPGDAAFHLLAATVHGKIASDFLEKENRQGQLVQKVDAIIGADSGATLQMQATTGDIGITEVNP